MSVEQAKVKENNDASGDKPVLKAHIEASRNLSEEAAATKPKTENNKPEVAKPADKLLPKLELVDAPVLDKATIDKHAQELHQAINRRKYLGLSADPDQEKIERILGPMSKADRQALNESYARQFGGGDSTFLRKELKSKLDDVGFTKTEAILNRNDGRTNDAGAVKVALAEMANDPQKGNAEVARVLKGLNSEQFKQLKEDFQRDYGKSFEQAMAENPKLSKAIKDSLPELTKGSDLRNAEDITRMANNAVAAHDRELFTSFIAGDSPAAVQARQSLQKDAGFRSKLAGAFPSDLALQMAEYGTASQLTVDERTDKVILDYLNKGHVGLDTIAQENTGKWIFNNKENIELAVKNATPEERAKFVLGQQLSENGSARTAVEKEAVDFYTKLNKAFADGSSPREVSVYQDNLINGRPTIVSEMAKTHSEGWDPFGLSAGHSKQELLNKSENLSQEDWAKLRDPEKGPAFRKQIEDSLKTYADPLERERVMKILDEKAKAPTYEAARGVGRSLADTISDNTGSAFLGMGTSYNTRNITERLANMSAEDADRYKNDRAYRQQIDDFVAKNMNSTEQLYSKRLLAQVEQSGKPPVESAVDKVLANSIKGTKGEDSIRDIEKALADPALRERLNKPDASLSPEDRQLKRTIESQTFKLVTEKTYGGEDSSYQFGLANKLTTELLTNGKLSPASKLDMGFKKTDVIAELGHATAAERTAAERFLNPQERQIVENLSKQNGEMTTADKLRTFIVTGDGNYKDFQAELAKLSNAQKQELKDEYSRKYGGALNEDFLSKVTGEQGEKNIYRQYLTPTDSDGRQDLYDNYAKLLESRSGFSADGTVLTAERANQLHADALEKYNREFQKLSPEQQKAMNEFFGQSMEQYKNSKEKLAEILTDATITAAALAAAPFTAGLSTAALVGVIGSAAAAGATYRVAMFKTIQGNDFDSSAQNILKQGLIGGTTAAFNFVGPELFAVTGRFATAAGTNIAKELAETSVSATLVRGADQILAREVKELAAKRGFTKLTEEEVSGLVAKVAQPGASEAERQALKVSLEKSVNSNFEKAAADASSELVKKASLGRQVVENAAIGSGSNVASELIVAPFNKDGVDWNNLQQGAWTGLAMGAIMPVAFRAVSHIGGGMKTVYTNVTKGPDGAFIDPKSITEPISFRNTKTGEITTIRPNEGDKFKLTNEWQPEAGGRSVNDDPRFKDLALAHPEIMARSDKPFAPYQAQDYSLKIADRNVAITGDTVTLGRQSSNNVSFDEISVSREHARIKFEGSKATLTDLNSTYGTTVNGRQLRPGEAVEIKPGDRIQLGRDKPFEFGLKPEFHLSFGDKNIDLVAGTNTIGRGSNNDVVLHGDAFSRNHATIEATARGPQITDLRSTNGTFVNGRAIEPNTPVLLQPGDSVRFGKDGPTYKLGKGSDAPTLPRDLNSPEVKAVEAQPRKVMEYNPGRVDNAARPEAVSQSNSFKDNGEVRGKLENGFQTLSGDARIGPDGKWFDPHRPGVVFDRTQDTVLNDAIAEAHRRFDHLRNDPAKLSSELAKYSKELMHPKGWSEQQVDAAYREFRNDNRGKRILLGDFIARAARNEGAGVCQHQALLMKALGDDFGLDVSIVNGFYGAKPTGGFPRDTFANHAWNEVHIKGETTIYDPRQQYYGEPSEKLSKHNPARLWLRGENAAPLERPVKLELRVGQEVSFEGNSHWKVSAKAPEVPGNIVIENAGSKRVDSARFAELNGNKTPEIGREYQLRRSDGNIEGGWQFKGYGRDGELNFFKENGVRIEVPPKELARQNPDLNEVRRLRSDDDIERVLSTTKTELKPEDILSPASIKQVSREIAERMREVPISSRQFESMFDGLNQQQREIALQLMEKSSPNLHSRALDAQLASLGQQLEHNGSVTIYTLGGDSSGNPLAYLFRKNNPGVKVDIKILDEHALASLKGRSTNEQALIFDDLSKATPAQRQFLGSRNNLAVADLGGFDKGVNLWDFGASKYAGTDLMRDKMRGLVAEAEQRMAQNPNLTIEQAAEQTLNPLSNTLKDINPKAKVVKPLESPDAAEMRELRNSLDSNEHVSELYNEITGPLISQQEVESFLGNLDVQRQAAAAMVLRDGTDVNTYSKMMDQMRSVQQQILERSGVRPEDLIIMHSFDSDGSAYLVNSLYARANGLKPEQFMSIDQIKSVEKGALKGKVVVYLDDVTYSGKQAADNITLNATDLQKSGARVAVGTLGAYDVPVDQNYWTMYQRSNALEYAQLKRLAPMVISGQRYSTFYSASNPLVPQFLNNPALLQQVAGRSTWSKSSVDSAIILPYGGPNNNVSLIADLLRAARMPGTVQ